MYENMCQIWWSVVLIIVFVAGTELETLPDCTGCKNEQAELSEFLKSQKIAHRLEYIKQQLITNLHVKNAPKEPPKFDSLPDFLVQKLVHEDTPHKFAGYSEGIVDDQTARQTVLFVEEEKFGCDTNNKRSLCLNFKLSDEILSSDINSATIWFHKESLPIFNNATQNFTIIDRTLLNVRNRNGRNITTYQQKDKDGWYRVDVTLLVRSWQTHQQNRHRVLTVSCDSCFHSDRFANETTRNFNKTSFLLLNTENTKNIRSKRGIECVPGKNECCREDLWVDFNTIEEYKMVVSPTRFNAYICRGNCFFPSPTDAGVPYATLLTWLKVRKPDKEYSLPTTCCTPTKFSPLQVLYAADNLTVRTAKIDNMVVESCGCI